jgi:leucyl aminopeptidase
MEFFSRSGNPARMKAGCIILGVFDDGSFCGPTKEIEAASEGLLAGLKRSGDLPRTAGHVLVVPEPRGIAARRLMLIGCGKKSAFGIKAYRRAVGGAAVRLEKLGSADAILLLAPAKAAAYARARHGVEAAEYAWYRFDELKTGKKAPKPRLKRFGFYLDQSKDRAASQRGIEHGAAIAEGQSVARRLANLPSNRCTPSYLASIARKLAKESPKMKADVLGEAQMKKLGMGSLLSVTAGSLEPAKLIVLNYRGQPGAKTVALVGKGITFDSGGISLKPPQGMDEMKFDMGGAASVLGTMTAIARLRPAINVVAVVPACENMPSGLATKPGDIVKSMSGKTIEILNTDAEGRLILCDALTYCRRFKPDAVIDVATLTGACVIALGHHLTGLMTRSDKLADDLLEAGKMASDRAWRLPLGEEYDEGLRSNFADFANVGGREGGAITAGCFLGRFTEGLEWAHLDVAGTAWQSGRNKGATGRPVPLLMQYLLDKV